jgi:hypothetical protein
MMRRASLGWILFAYLTANPVMIKGQLPLHSLVTTAEHLVPPRGGNMPGARVGSE